MEWKHEKTESAAKLIFLDIKKKAMFKKITKKPGYKQRNFSGEDHKQWNFSGEDRLQEISVFTGFAR